MAFLFESILNLVGFMVGLTVGTMSYIGYRNTGSPTLFRLAIAFFSISTGFFVIWMGFMIEDLILKNGHIIRWVQTLGISIQTVGYFFIAFSHGIKSFFPRNRYLRSVALLPLFLISESHIENIFRATSFILLVYGSIETLLSFFDTRKRGAILVASGLAMLAFGEFVGWYYFVFPESLLYHAAISIKIAGLVLLFVPLSKASMMRMRFDDPADRA